MNECIQIQGLEEEVFELSMDSRLILSSMNKIQQEITQKRKLRVQVNLMTMIMMMMIGSHFQSNLRTKHSQR